MNATQTARSHVTQMTAALDTIYEDENSDEVLEALRAAFVKTLDNYADVTDDSDGVACVPNAAMTALEAMKETQR